MTIKDILVPLDHSTDCRNSLEVSGTLAEQFNAHVTGLHVNDQLSYEVYGEVLYAGIIEAVEQQRQNNIKNAKHIFENRFKKQLDRSTFVSVQGVLATQIVRHASFQDIVVVDQLGPEAHIDMGTNVPEQVALGSGRPTLVVPYIGCGETIGRNILIAWNGKREAVRAVNDAMPFLTEADNVKLLSINQGQQDELSCFEIGEHLARHDVNVEVQQAEVNDMQIADYLLSRAADFESDMLVMGAYGHSRFREYTLGGVTRTILKTMTVPVLLSH